MRGVIMYAPGDVRVEDREHPTIIEPTDAIIKLAASCICGSDLWPYRGAEPVDDAPMGHEYVGVVTEIGEDVKNIRSATSSSDRSSPPTTPVRSARRATSRTA